MLPLSSNVCRMERKRQVRVYFKFQYACMLYFNTRVCCIYRVLFFKWRNTTKGKDESFVAMVALKKAGWKEKKNREQLHPILPVTERNH